MKAIVSFVFSLFIAIHVFDVSPHPQMSARCAQSIPPHMSEAFKFFSRHQFYPNVYAFSDRAERSVRLDFIGRDTMQVVNTPQGKKHQSFVFVDVYKTHFDYQHHQRVIVVDRLLYTSRRNRAVAPMTRPFHPDDLITDVMSVMPLLAPGDTAIVGTDEDVILAGGLLFEINLKEYGTGAQRILKSRK